MSRFQGSMLAIAALAIALSAGSCDGQTAGDGTAAAAPQGIVGGDLEDGWPGVGALAFYYPGNGYVGSFCSGTLIDPEWVLTAAHCLLPSEDVTPYPELTYFYDGPDANPASADGAEPEEGTLYAVDAFYTNPSYSTSTGNYDVALVHLQEPIDSITPYQIYTGSGLPSEEGELAFYVGYGVTNGTTQPGGGVKRSTWITIDNVNSLQYSSSYEPTETGVCFGDSGGPGFYDFGSGYYVIGINSTVSGYSDPCMGYYNHTRVDAVDTWITNTMAANPDCESDSDLCVCADACEADGGCDNTLCQTLDCSALYDCLYACGSTDEECYVGCYVTGTDEAQDEYDAMAYCLYDNCNDITDEDAYMECATEFCTAEINTCLMGDPCNILGGDCDDDACYVTSTLTTACFPSEGSGDGEDCANTSSTVGCSDGLICISGVCHDFCLGVGDCEEGETCNDGIFPDYDESLGYCDEPSSDTDADTDSDTDSDTDADTDADSDSDTDSDTDSDSDGDSDTDAPGTTGDDGACGCVAAGARGGADLARGLLAALFD